MSAVRSCRPYLLPSSALPLDSCRSLLITSPASVCLGDRCGTDHTFPWGVFFLRLCVCVLGGGGGSRLGACLSLTRGLVVRWQVRRWVGGGGGGGGSLGSLVSLRPFGSAHRSKCHMSVSFGVPVLFSDRCWVLDITICLLWPFFHFLMLVPDTRVCALLFSGY